MKTFDVRSKYLQFFQNLGHKVITPAPLVLQNDPTTLFTSSGMQPLVPYLLGEPHPEGKRVVDSQPCIRVQDIEDVGDNRHDTFFEMLGNWSFGEYFKSEQIPWIWEFFTKDLGLDPSRIYVTIFEGLPAQTGNDSVPKDEEAKKIWLELGIPKERIFEYDVSKNWWSRSGPPAKMPAGEIGGPSSEVFYEFGDIEHDPEFGEKCHPNCDCGRFIEIGNSVFIQYKKLEDGNLEELPQKNVDFGGGLERIAAAVNDNPDVFTIDVFSDVIAQIEKVTGKSYRDETYTASMRIIADHLRAASFLIKSEVVPSNKAQGYILRRLLRRAAIKMRSLQDGHLDPTVFDSIAASVVQSYDGVYFESKDDIKIAEVIGEELEKFSKTLENGLKQLQKLEKISGQDAFNLYQSFGFPLELTIELAGEKGQKPDEDEFKKEFEKHQNLSRTQSAGAFKGGLADHSKETTALHTATHLLHAALRKTLGESVGQKGSHITADRLRFDFTFDRKITDEEIKKIESMVNEQIDKDLPVSFEIMSLDEARSSGALAFFDQKYEEKVKVYTIGNPDGEWFSKEVCGGPHVNSLGEIGGHVTIKKQESVSAGVRRIYAILSK